MSTIEFAGAPLMVHTRLDDPVSGVWAKSVTIIPPWWLRWNGRAFRTARECRALVICWVGR